MCKCMITGKELPEANVYLAGYECRESGRYCCPNYMHNMSEGKNCRLLQSNKMIFAKLSNRSVLEPIKEGYSTKSTEELQKMYVELREKHKSSNGSQSNVILRARIGAIEELLHERRFKSETA